jgi:hypothetical protein
MTTTAEAIQTLERSTGDWLSLVHNEQTTTNMTLDAVAATQHELVDVLNDVRDLLIDIRAALVPEE